MVLYVYVIVWVAMVFGNNSMSNTGRKPEIARGEAECYFRLPTCITNAIISEYHSKPCYHRLIV